MNNDMPFTYAELLILLEAARIGLADANVFDDAVDKVDISDKEMSRISAKLNTFLDADIKTAEKTDYPKEAQ